MVSLYYLVLIGARLRRSDRCSCRINTPPSMPTMCARRQACRPIRKADMIESALTDAVKRMRVDIKEWQQEGSRVIVTRHLDQADRRAQHRAISTAPMPSTTPRSRASRPTASK